VNQRLFADENFPAPSILILREAGHDVQSVAEAAASTADLDVLAMAVAQQRWIVTFDRDFGELIFFDADWRPHPACCISGCVTTYRKHPAPCWLSF